MGKNELERKIDSGESAETIDQSQESLNELDVYTGVSKETTRGALITALAAAKLEFEPIQMTGKNPTFGNKYAKLENIIKATAKSLARHGLVVTQTTKRVQGQALLVTTLWHESGESLISETVLVAESAPDNRAINELQREGIVRTYMRRYELAGILGVAGEEDIDGDQEEKNKKGQPSTSEDSLKPTASNNPLIKSDGAGITPKQRKFTLSLGRKHGMEEQLLNSMAKDWYEAESLSKLTMNQASEFIETLQKKEIPIKKQVEKKAAEAADEVIDEVQQEIDEKEASEDTAGDFDGFSDEPPKPTNGDYDASVTYFAWMVQAPPAVVLQALDETYSTQAKRLLNLKQAVEKDGDARKLMKEACGAVAGVIDDDLITSDDPVPAGAGSSEADLQTHHHPPE